MARLSETALVDPTSRVEDCRLGRYVEVQADSHLQNVEMGDYSYCAGRNEIANAVIGKFANIASGVRIGPGNHPYWRASLHHFMYRSASYWDDAEDEAWMFDWRRAHPVSLGHDTWLGYNAVILPGVSVGNGAIVGAGAVVTKDVAPYTIVGGVPGAPIKPRFPQPLAEALQALAWWDWSHETLREALPDFRALSAEAFVEKYA